MSLPRRLAPSLTRGAVSLEVPCVAAPRARPPRHDGDDAFGAVILLGFFVVLGLVIGCGGLLF